MTGGTQERGPWSNPPKYDPPLDEGVRLYVVTLAAEGVETFESCEGGRGHTFTMEGYGYKCYRCFLSVVGNC